MNLKNILSIPGRPGLYKPVSKGKNMLIVEPLSADKKRFPIYNYEKAVSLGDIAMYTDEGEMPLKDVLTLIKEKENGAAASINAKKASPDELRDYLNAVLPSHDREKVHTGDIKKLISWYNNLVACGITDFQEEGYAQETQPDTPAE
jgi:hypothetical protein